MVIKDTVVKQLKEDIKLINKEREIEERQKKMITLIDTLRNQFNEEIDDIFSEVNLKRKRINLDDYKL